MTKRSARTQYRIGQVAILVAAVAWSSAGVVQRQLETDAATQVAGRAFFAAIGLLVLVFALERSRTPAAFRTMGRWGWTMTAVLAVSSGTFLLALNHTSVANVLFMQAAAPMMAALLGWALLSELVGLRTWLAMGLAGVGVIVMIGGSLATGWLAVGLPFVMTASFAGVIVIARYRRKISMLPATCASQVLLVLVALPFATLSLEPSDWAFLALLGVGQIGLGLALLTYGARLIPPAEVAVISLLEVVLGVLWVWLAYSERPGLATLVGGAVILAAILIQATADDRPRVSETGGRRVVAASPAVRRSEHQRTPGRQ